MEGSGSRGNSSHSRRRIKTNRRNKDIHNICNVYEGDNYYGCHRGHGLDGTEYDDDIFMILTLFLEFLSPEWRGKRRPD